MNKSIVMQPAENSCLIIYDLSQRIDYSPVSSVLELIVSFTHSAAAHLYWMDPAAYELRLVSASSTPEDSRIPRVSLEFPKITQRWLLDLPQAAVVPAGNPNFARFPETVASGFSCLLAFPLRVREPAREERLAGILTVCRKDVRSFAAADIETAGKLVDALVASMKELDRQSELGLLREKLRSARQENSLLERRLAERKLVDRAKGLLQIHYGWTEEDAYYHIRKTSRQQRTPMGIIAQRIIDVSAARDAERERLTA
jgi:hypothetical protein